MEHIKGQVVYTYPNGVRYQYSDCCPFDDERNDCAVLALALARPMPYDQAHDLLADFGRRRAHRTHARVLQAAYASVGLRRYFPGRVTVGRFLQEFRGTAIVDVRGHVFAVLDGVVHDRFPPRQKQIILGVFYDAKNPVPTGWTATRR